MTEEKRKKTNSKTTTTYILKNLENGKEKIFKNLNEAQLYSWVYHNDFHTYTICKRTVIIKEDLIESGANEIGEDNPLQAAAKIPTEERRPE